MKNSVKIVLLILAATLFSGCAIFGDSYKPPKPAKLVQFTPTLNVHRAWGNSSSYGTSREHVKLSPAAAGNKVYTASYLGYVTAIDTQNGAKIWKVNAKVPITSGLAASYNKVFFGTGNGVLLALNQADGKVAWWRWVDSEVLATPTVAGRVVLVKTENGQLSAFNVTNGKFLWTYKQQEPTLILRGSSSPQVFGNRVIVGFADGNLLALDLHTGREIWHRPIAIGRGETIVQRMVDIDVTPYVSGGVIYVASYQGRIAAIKLQNGRLLWQHKLSSYSGLAVGRNAVYISDETGIVWAFSKKNGSVLWKQDDLLNRGLTAPALVGNYLVVADSLGYAHFMAKSDGHFVARYYVTRYGISAAPLVVGNSIYIYGNAGRLVKLIV